MVSEIHALCIDPPFLIQNPRSFQQALNPVLLPKMSMEVPVPLGLELTAFTQSLLGLWSGVST